MTVNSKYNRFITWLQKNKLYPFLYILPIVPFVIAYFFYPLIFSVILSFTDWTGIKLSKIEFIGIGNFIRLFDDRIFLVAFKNTILFVITTLIIQNFLGFTYAFILHYAKIKGAKAIRAIIFFPVVVAPVIVGLIWRLILNNEGMVNQILGKIGLESLQMAWLGNAVTPMIMVILVNAWQYTGYNMILFHAGLQNVPDELMEAAKIDGANIFQVIRRVVLPLLTPIITIILVLSVIGGFKVFDVVYSLTRGGPANLSEVISTYMFYTAFSVYGPGRYGYASAIALFLTLIIFIFSYLRIRFTREEIGE